MTFLKYESLWGDYWEDYFDKSKVEKKRIDWITDDLLNNKKLSLDLLGGSYLKFEEIIKSRSKDNIGW